MRRFFAVMILLAATAALAHDWPTFLGPTGDSKSPETGLKFAWPETGPPILWTHTTGTGYSMPVIADRKLFHLERIGRNITLNCLDATTGKSLWNFSYPSDYEDTYGYDNGPRTSPVVSGESVVTLGPEGMLHCLSVDGKPRWKHDTRAEYNVMQNFFGVGSSPIVYQNLVIVGIGGSPKSQRDLPPGAVDQMKANGTGVVAFDLKTGDEVYRVADELASYASPMVAKLNNKDVGLHFARGGLLAFDPSSGKERFKFPWRAKILESVNASNPLVVGNQILISETYGPGAALLQVKGDDFEVVWSDEKQPRNKSLQTHWNTPIHVDGYVYGSSGRHENTAELRCIELATGKVMWSEPDLRRSSLLWVDGKFICLSEDGTLRVLAVNPKKYECLATSVLVDKDRKTAFGSPDRLLKPPAWAAPIVCDGRLYVRGRDRLVCLDIKE